MNRTCEIIIYFDPKQVVKDMKKGKPAKNTMAISFIGHTTMARWAVSPEGSRTLKKAREFYVKMYHDAVGYQVDYDVEFLSACPGGHRDDVFVDLAALADNGEEQKKDEAYLNQLA